MALTPFGCTKSVFRSGVMSSGTMTIWTSPVLIAGGSHDYRPRTHPCARGVPWRGNAGKAGCPCHDDRTPSMSVRDGDCWNTGPLLCWDVDPTTLLQELRRQGVWEKPEGKRRSRRRRVIERPVEHKPDPIALELWEVSKA